MLARWQVERLPGAHCYEFYATANVFHALADAEPGTFYLTDFLVRHFDRLVIEDLQLNTHPTLRDTLFAHYTRVVYLAQTEDTTLWLAPSAQPTSLPCHWRSFRPVWETCSQQ